MNRALACVVMLAIVAASCKKAATPPPPSVGGAGEPVPITGRERIAWEQSAASLTALTQLAYAIYVDNVRSILQGASCTETAIEGQFGCTAALPALSPGVHVLELATYLRKGGAESARSSPLRVNVQGSSPGTSSVAPSSEASAEEQAWSPGAAGVTSDRLPLVVERVADGLDDPVDMAVAPDGRVFVAERSGRLHVLDDAATGGVTAPVDIEHGQLLAIALDPAFTRTHRVYALYAAPTGNEWTYRIARFRELAGVLGERAVIVNTLMRSADPHPTPLRLTTDGDIVVVTPPPDNAASSSDTSSRRTVAPWQVGASARSGRLLRFAADGATPATQRGSPIVAEGLQRPAAAAWARARSAAWIVDDDAGGPVLIEVAFPPREAPRRVAAHRLPYAPYGSVTVCEDACWPGLQGNLLLAAGEGRHILRVRMTDDAARPIVTERLLQDRVGDVLLVAMAPDGSVYFATPRSVGRLSPLR